MDVHTNRRLHGNAGREWTFVSAASCSPSHLHFTISIARLHRITTASGPSSIPFRRPASHIAEDPGPSIAIVTQDSSRIGPLRGFLPRGLLDACPHAPRHTRSHVIEGRRPITLNDSTRSHRPPEAAPENSNVLTVARSSNWCCRPGAVAHDPFANVRSQALNRAPGQPVPASFLS